jgi:hypothetical protein
MSYCVVLTVIAVAGRVFLHSRWANLRDRRQATGVTWENGPIVKLFWLNSFDGGGGGILVLEMECLFVAGAAFPGRKFNRLGGR